MELVYLVSAIEDISWVKHYYERVFPAGAAQGRAHIKATEALIMENPYIGRPVENFERVREFSVNRTPFSFIYRVADKQIEVLRVLDKRSVDADILRGA